MIPKLTNILDMSSIKVKASLYGELELQECAGDRRTQHSKELLAIWAAFNVMSKNWDDTISLKGGH